MDFNSVAGQKEVVASLVNSVRTLRIGHAYIFNGPAGIGKGMIAGIFAGLLLCEKPGEGRSCESCQPCEMLRHGSNPDFKIVEGNETAIGVDEIRKIQADIIIRPMYSQRKVYLIINAENMTAQAQNCLLKTLEEPPAYAVLILTTTNYDALLETIRSRAVCYSFKKNTKSEIHEVLSRKYASKSGNMDFAVLYSDGIIGKALEITESDEFSVLRDRAFEILLRLKKSNLIDAFQIYEFFEIYKNNLDTVLDIMLLFYRDLLVLKKTGKENVLINYDKKDIILSNVSGFSAQKLAGNIENIELTRRNIKQNANYQLSIEVMLMKLQEE